MPERGEEAEMMMLVVVIAVLRRQENRRIAEFNPFTKTCVVMV